MYAPDESPDTEVCARSTLKDGNGSEAFALLAATDAARVELRIVQRHFAAAAAHAGSARCAAMEGGAAWLDELGAQDGLLIAPPSSPARTSRRRW
jgi:hypothetical protein